MSKIRAFVVDDSGFVIASVTKKLSTDPDIEVVGSARDGKEAIEKNPYIKTGRYYAGCRHARDGWIGCAGAVNDLAADTGCYAQRADQRRRRNYDQGIGTGRC